MLPAAPRGLCEFEAALAAEPSRQAGFASPSKCPTFALPPEIWRRVSPGPWLPGTPMPRPRTPLGLWACHDSSSCGPAVLSGLRIGRTLFSGQFCLRSALQAHETLSGQHRLQPSVQVSGCEGRLACAERRRGDGMRATRHVRAARSDARLQQDREPGSGGSSGQQGATSRLTRGRRAQLC